jgi:O-antigen ligase
MGPPSFDDPLMSHAIFDPVANARRRLGVSALEAQGLVLVTSLVLYFVMVVNQAHVETDEAVKLAPRLELLMRLGGTAIAGIIGLYGVTCIGRVQRAALRFPGLWVLGITACYLVSTLFSDYKTVAVPHLIPFLCVVLFTPTAFAILGTRRFFEISLMALLTTLAASWLLYWFFPQYGVDVEVTDAVSGAGVGRMGGTCHPNTLAGMAGFAVLIVCGFMDRGLMRRSIAWAILLFCGATFVLTQSRVATVSTILAVLFVYRGFWLRRDVFPWTLALAAVTIMACGLLFFGNFSESLAGRLVESLTRSGEVRELTSFTGRIEIWANVLDLIAASPLLGYGPGVAKLLLGERDLLLHAHNVVLAMALTGGVFCGLFTAMMFLQQMWISWQGKFALAALISVYVFLNSLTETWIFSYLPGITTMLWLAALGWPDLDDGSLEDPQAAMPDSLSG